MSDLLAHAEAIWEAVVPSAPGFTVEVLRSIDSTNSELMRRARDGLLEPLLLVAEEQTAGRGRLGRHWHSRAGQSLTFSLALPMVPLNWSGLSLAVGVSLANSLHPDVKLKWPNDLWLHERKLGGILVETAGSGATPTAPNPQPRLVVVGVGINIARPMASAVAPSADLASTLVTMEPAGLAEVLVGMDAGETLERVVVPLVNDLQAFAANGFAAFAERFAQRDALRDRAVRLSDGTEGTACGVDADGALMVLTAKGMRHISSSEVSVRPC
ncbi:BirA family biotin operon repressor/biotin-[acetyl-CoA-carboxylase] ligase [Hydrogenophaga palleronii]|uniref:biotin--[biotin carboxyl-carrier protein] ligase n=1 Tax=Hydrogenophaga palleronii TaxID=65655 RepID=A0ABU1WV07_9BURK|nr:biotin--[acetyl-CoA-carboxylase] ligase [Hydrogenophaga palleronii]MDR7153145.1 BirA family biotin operon repressor/biotin-[acetyl-CoA-carboxylase] ligase [Hydrogenophaga palleronii]